MIIHTSLNILTFLALFCLYEFLVFNEELLIVIAFSIFLYLVSSYASTSIVEELDEKAKVIQNKFDIYKNIEEKTIIHLLNYHNKRELLSEKIRTISKIKKLRMNTVHQYYQTNLNKQTLLQIEDILNRFILNEYINTFAFQEKFVFKLNNLKKRLRFIPYKSKGEKGAIKNSIGKKLCKHAKMLTPMPMIKLIYLKPIKLIDLKPFDPSLGGPINPLNSLAQLRPYPGPKEFEPPIKKVKKVKKVKNKKK